MHTEMDGAGSGVDMCIGGDVFIPDPVEGLKRTKSLVFREYVPVKTLGNGRYGLVKEAMHIKTGKHVAMKVINKAQLKKAEWAMIENEIDVLEKVSRKHPNVIHLYAHFTVANELYLIMDLCTGGELFDLIYELGSFYEDDAQRIIYTLLDAVAHLHENNVVHRDLKPENILIRSPVDILGTTEEEPAEGETPKTGHANGNGEINGAAKPPAPKFVPKRDIVVADFGISRIVDPSKGNSLRTRIGSPGYMSPEVIKGEAYGSPVDVWSIGVIAYLLLSGYMPFHDDEMLDEMQNIMLGRYSFDPAEQWDNISDEAKDFIRKCLSPKPEDRPTCREAMQHPWLNKTPATHEEALLHPNEALHNVHPDANLLPIVKQNFNARRRFRRVINTVRMLNRLNIGMSEYAQRMERVGFYGVNSGSFKSYSSDASDTSLRHANTFEFNSVGGTPAYHRTHDPSPLSNGTRGPEDVAERHHVRSKSGTRTLTLPL